MNKKMNYESKWGDVNVELSMSQYTDNGNIYLELVNTEGEYPEPYGNITVNLVEVPKYCGYVDTNNMPEMEKFLEENASIRFMFSMWINYESYAPNRWLNMKKTLSVTEIKNMKKGR